MPSALSYPGVYVEEVPSGVRTLTGVATSITAFVGRAASGPTGEPVMLTSFADYERRFGGLVADCPMSYAVRDFYLNGGALALVVRVVGTAAPPAPPGPPPPPAPPPAPAPAPAAAAAAATLTLPTGLTLTAASVGAWGKRLSAKVDYDTDSLSGTDTTRFNLILRFQPRQDRDEYVFETIGSVSTTLANPRYLPLVLERESTLVRALGAVPAARPSPTPNWVAAIGGEDGPPLRADDVLGSAASRTGIHALANVDLFNLLVIPPLARDTSALPSTYTPVPANVWQGALAMCVERRAMLIVDPDPAWGASAASAVSNAQAGRNALGFSGTAPRNAALYYPCLRMVDPLRDNRVDTFMPSGAVAGIMARTDVARGVWKAPAGLDAGLNGVQDLQVNLNDLQNGQLNPLGINCLRTFPVVGPLVWGARTLEGADALDSAWKYVPVRRLALHVEESLHRGLQWVVFEPNSEQLWQQIRLKASAYLNDLFRQGAFKGGTPREAYFVKCDKDTTTDADIDAGVVNVVIGIAPVKPAEFVIVKIQQMAGQFDLS